LLNVAGTNPYIKHSKLYRPVNITAIILGARAEVSLRTSDNCFIYLHLEKLAHIKYSYYYKRTGMLLMSNNFFNVVFTL
jgi:hypothetical protein